ncbi:MAG TPA: hypothetical protein VHB45_03105 [Alloacidobacterium sp.]|nr:hypothetical protein [Alloacidobacterium sp.]
MQCPSCRNEIAPQATFCGFCGAPVAAAAAPAGYAPVGGNMAAAPVAPATAPAASGLSENAAAAISYITIIPAIIFLVLEPYNRMRLVKFHAIQCIALHVAWIAVWVALTILNIALHFIPFISVLFLLADMVVAVGFFIAWLVCILKASKGEYFKLPIIGQFAAKQANV